MSDTVPALLYPLNGFRDQVAHRLGWSETDHSNPAWALIQFMRNLDWVQVQDRGYPRQETVPKIIGSYS